MSHDKTDLLITTFVDFTRQPRRLWCVLESLFNRLSIDTPRSGDSLIA